MKNFNIKKKNFSFLAILFTLGIIFLFLSEYDSSRGLGFTDTTSDEKAYVENLETRLSQMINELEGASQAKVMITLEGSSRQQFATEKVMEEGTGNSVYTFLMQKDAGGNTSPILIGTDAPKIMGVSVVAQGAENILVRQKILELVAGTLNLNQNKIFVAN